MTHLPSSDPPEEHSCRKRKTIRMLRRGLRRLEGTVATWGTKLDQIGNDVSSLLAGQQAILGGPTHLTDSMAITQQDHGRRIAALETHRSKWRDAIVSVVVMLVTLVATKGAEYVSAHPPSAPIASPIPVTTPRHEPTLLPTALSTATPRDLQVPKMASDP